MSWGLQKTSKPCGHGYRNYLHCSGSNIVSIGIVYIHVDELLRKMVYHGVDKILIQSINKIWAIVMLPLSLMLQFDNGHRNTHFLAQ